MSAAGHLLCRLTTLSRHPSLLTTSIRTNVCASMTGGTTASKQVSSNDRDLPDNVREMVGSITALGRLRIQPTPADITRCQDDMGNKLPSVVVEGSLMKDYHGFVPVTLDLRHQMPGSDPGMLSVDDVLTLLTSSNSTDHRPLDEQTPEDLINTLAKILDIQDDRVSDISPFTRCAVVHHLCDCLTSTVNSLTTGQLLTLLDLLTTSVYGSAEFQLLDVINSDVLHRAASSGSEEAFSIPQTASLISALSRCVGSEAQHSALPMLWSQIVRRVDGFTEADLPHLYPILMLIPNNVKWDLLRDVESRTVQSFWKLSADDVISLLSSLCELHYNSTRCLHATASWLTYNLQDVSQMQLITIINTFNYFAYRSDQLIKAIERYLLLTPLSVDSAGLVTSVMSYLGSERVISKRIMNTVTEYFMNHCESLSPEVIGVILRQYGHLYYLPNNAQHFFRCIEQMFHSRFTQFSHSILLDIFISFTYLHRFPLNFMTRLFNPLSMLHHTLVTEKSSSSSSAYSLVTKFKLLESSLQLECPGYRWSVARGSRGIINLLQGGSKDLYTHTHPGLRSYPPSTAYIHDSRLVRLRSKLLPILGEILGSKDYCHVGKFITASSLRLPLTDRYVADFVWMFDADGQPLNLSSSHVAPHTLSGYENDGNIKRVSVLVTLPEHVVTCLDDGKERLSGDQMIKSRHLHIMGYHVIRVKYSDFISMPESQWKPLLVEAVNQSSFKLKKEEGAPD